MKFYYVCFEDLVSGIFSSAEAAWAAVKKAAQANPNPILMPVDLPSFEEKDIALGIPYFINEEEKMFFIEQYELDIPFENYD